MIPVYNEAGHIGETIRAIETKVKTPRRIYIVYDFDEDNTLPLVRGLKEGGVDLVLLKNSAGRVVTAIRTGLRGSHDSGSIGGCRSI